MSSSFVGKKEKPLYFLKFFLLFVLCNILWEIPLEWGGYYIHFSEKNFFLRQLLLMIISIMVICSVISILFKRSPREYLGLHSFKKVSVVNVFLMYIMINLFSAFVIALMKWTHLLPKSANEQKNFFSVFPPYSIWIFLGLCVFTPITEEIIYRGFLLKGLGNNPWGRDGAIVMSALVFAFMHAGWQSWEVVVFSFIIGMFYGWVFCEKKTLWETIILHGLNNSVAWFFLVQESH